MEKMRAEDGGQRELVHRWFTETQAPLFLRDGTFPDWFKGFAARRETEDLLSDKAPGCFLIRLSDRAIGYILSYKETEDLLSDKAPGCFLIRLSDRAIGYILSYKGSDRCRHFVITQNPAGQFVIAGDSQPHGSLGELIEHYRLSPIQPFGEHLTSSWSEVSAGDADELYDVVNYRAKETPGLSVRALRTLWDQKHDLHGNHGAVEQSDAAAAAVGPPALPTKLKSRRLTGTVSLSQDVPSVQKRGLLPGLSLRGSLPDTTPQTQTDPGGSEGVRENMSPMASPDGDSFFWLYSEIRSTSLPTLRHGSVEEEEDVLPPPAPTPHSTAPLKKTTCLTYSVHQPASGSGPGGSEQPGAESMRCNPLYQTSAGPGPAQPRGATYAEVPRMPAPTGLPENTYERIPDEAVQGNTYESLEDVKNKSQSNWGKNYGKLKKFLPDHKKK